MQKLFFSILFSFFSTLSFAEQTQPSDVISNFDSNIYVNKNASLNITEKITIYTSLQTIKHGITRKLPLVYRDSDGKHHHVIYQIEQVLKNNQPSPFHLTQNHHQLLVHMGARNVLLTPGSYTYTLKYRVKNGLSFLKTTDKLNWNVTGNEWEFPILQAYVQIELPQSAIIKDYSGYTGILGAKEQHYKVKQLADTQLSYQVLSPLAVGESFGISVAWNKGIINKPYWVQTLTTNFLQKKSKTIIGGIILLLLGYYFFIWNRQRPQLSSTHIPVFAPPENLSPEAVRFINRMRFDIKIFTIAIINMAIKGYLSIKKEKNVFKLTKLSNDTRQLDIIEQRLAEKLFAKNTSFALLPENYKAIHKMKAELYHHLKKAYQSPYFTTNIIYVIPGILLGLVAFIFTIFSSPNHSAAFFAIVWLSGWTAACLILATRVINYVKLLIYSFSLRNLLCAFFSTLFCVFFILGDLAGLFIFSRSVNIKLVICLFCILMINFIFYFLLKNPTAAGKKIIEQIEGFKLFLTTSERYQLNQFHALDLPHLFEKYLPYAIALDIENKWIEQFQSLQKNAQKKAQYTPSWYQTDVSSSSLVNVATLANELNTALSSISGIPIKDEVTENPLTIKEAKQTETLD